MGSKNQTTPTTQVQTPFNAAQLNYLYSQGRDRYEQGPPAFFPGQTMAPTAPASIAGRAAGTQYASSFGPEYTAMIREGLDRGLTGVLDPASQPGVQQGLQTIQQNATQNLNENIMPGIREAGLAGSTYGGSRGQIAAGLAAGRTGQGIASAQGQLLDSAYGRGLNTFSNTLNNAGNIFQSGAAPGQLLEQIGQANRADTQGMIGAARERFDYEQNAPDAALAQLAQLLQTGTGAGGTTQGEQVTSSASPWMQALGAALAAYGSYAAIAASSRAYKTDKEPITILDKLASVPVERWRYHGQRAFHIGPYAEDFNVAFGVGQEHPNAIAFQDLLGVILGGMKELYALQRGDLNGN